MLAVCGLVMVMSENTHACNIPVFRYALERWRPDLCEVVIFHDQKLSPDNARLVSTLKAESLLTDGTANVEVVVRQVDSIREPDLVRLWDTIKSEAVPLPCAVVQTRTGRDEWIQLWAGPLADLDSEGLVNSPVRTELAERLLQGDAAVWLIVPGEDVQQAHNVSEFLNEELARVAAAIPFPEGIGLPGSELYSSIPLEFRFSVLEVDANDPREAFFVSTLRQSAPVEVDAASPVVVPIFGRGRALTVVPGDRLTPQLLDELTFFLCGACSCQIKEANPGFDLLLKTPWDEELFGGSRIRGVAGPEVMSRTFASPASEPAEPVLVAIPPGQDREDFLQAGVTEPIVVSETPSVIAGDPPRRGAVSDLSNTRGESALGWALVTLIAASVVLAAGFSASKSFHA